MAPRPIGPVALLVVACSGEMSPQPISSTGTPTADFAFPARGVADRGDDPAIVAIDVGGPSLCSGALVAPDVVLTAARCVATATSQAGCRAQSPQTMSTLAPQSIRILVGDETMNAQERARGLEVMIPTGAAPCGADIAVILLDSSIDEVMPLAVRAIGAAKGDRLRTVAFARLGSTSAVQKIVRDHLSVIDATTTELSIAESCQSGAGGPAMDESTGEIVGVTSRRGDSSSCSGAGAHDVYTRSDAFPSLIARAISKSSFVGVSTKSKKKTKKGPIDMGANCAQGTDCAAGVCVNTRLQEYCSRTCGPHDHCPSHFRCQKSTGPSSVCVEQ